MIKFCMTRIAVSFQKWDEYSDSLLNLLVECFLILGYYHASLIQPRTLRHNIQKS